MDNKNFENSIRQGLAQEADKLELSDKMLSRIINRIQDYEGGKKNMLRDKIPYITIKRFVTVSLCAVLILGGVMFTFSDEVKAATLEIVNSIKTIFVLEKTEDGYTIVEKTNQDVIFTTMNSRTSYLSDEELSDKLGFKIRFPKVLDGEFRLLHKYEAIGLKKQMSLEASEQLEPDISKVLEGKAELSSLSEYEPFRSVGGTYRRKAGASIFIDLAGPDSPAYPIDSKRDVKTKVGDHEAYWKAWDTADNYSNYYVKPNRIIKGHSLEWESNGIRYHLGTSYDLELTMEEAVKFAESFMSAQ